MFEPPEAVSVCFLREARVVQFIKGGEREVGKENKYLCVGVRKKFWNVIYCANTRPKPDSQSVSLSCKVMGRLAPHIIQEYNLATVIDI